MDESATYLSRMKEAPIDKKDISEAEFNLISMSIDVCTLMLSIFT